MVKTIKIVSWVSKDKEGNDCSESIVDVLKALLNVKDPRQMPIGFKQAQMFNRIIKAFDNKEELILDESDYEFLKKMVETDTPSLWGGNQNIMNALSEFLKCEN